MKTNSLTIVFVFSIFIISACFSLQAENGKSLQEILRESSLPVASINPDTSLDDLEFLRDLIGEAPIVILGESQHLAREQYLLKHRVTRFLIGEMGFRHIALEDSIFGTIAIDDYIQGEEISPAEALEKTGGWYLWDTEEMLAFVKWLRSHNDMVPDKQKVTYTGIDIEDPWPGIVFLQSYFGEVDQEFTVYLESQQHRLEVFNQPIWFMVKNNYADLSPSETREIGDIFRKTRIQLKERRDDYIKSGGSKRFKDCLKVVNNLERSHQYFVELQTIDDGEVGLREKTMFQNIVEIVEANEPEEKIIIWVHNAHAAKSPIALLGTSNRNTEEMRLLGTMLKEEFGEKVIAIGIASMGGEKAETSGQPEPGVLDHILADTGRELFFINIIDMAAKLIQKNPLDSDWKFTADQGGYLSLNPVKAFDGIFFIKILTDARHSARSGKRIKTLF